MPDDRRPAPNQRGQPLRLWEFAVKNWPRTAALIKKIAAVGGDPLILDSPRRLRRVRRRVLKDPFARPRPTSLGADGSPELGARERDDILVASAIGDGVKLPLEREDVWQAIVRTAWAQGKGEVIRDLEWKERDLETKRIRWLGDRVHKTLRRLVMAELRSGAYTVTGRKSGSDRTVIDLDDLLGLTPDFGRDQLVHEGTGVAAFENVAVREAQAPQEDIPATHIASAPPPSATKGNVHDAAVRVLGSGKIERKHGSKERLLDVLEREFPGAKRDLLRRYSSPAHAAWNEMSTTQRSAGEMG